MAESSVSARANPHLKEPVLYIDGLAASVTDEDIVQVMHECLRLRLSLDRSSASTVTGTVEFEDLLKAEKAYATTNYQRFAQNTCTLSLRLSPVHGQDPLPQALPRVLKALPLSYTAGQVFDLCRPFGPIHSATLQLSRAHSRGAARPPQFKGEACVVFYDEHDAIRMVQGLNFIELDGQNILATESKAARKCGRGRHSYPSTLSHELESVHDDPAAFPVQECTNVQPSPPRTSLNATAPEFASPVMSRNVSGASQWSNSTAETSHHDVDPPTPKSSIFRDGLTIDPCNLFIKSLDPSLSSHDLHDLFAVYGNIVSARVMTDQLTSRSKEFGFVSFEQPEQAQRALAEMDGKRIGTKIITVRLHEPRELRSRRMSPEGDYALSSAGHEVATSLSQLSTTHSTSTSSSDPQVVAVAASRSHLPPTHSSEHDRLVAAVSAIQPAKTPQLVELIESLPKKDRALCLFNPEILKQKVSDALLVLDAVEQSNQATPDPTDCPTSLPVSIKVLSQLPALDIVALLEVATPVLDLSIPTAAELESSKQLMRELKGLPVGQVKQRLGEKLFKVVKGMGIKRAVRFPPKITIDLLDSEDLHALSVLLHYPEIIKEKAVLLADPVQQ
ncbi:uncharacterized protein JCM15063_005210 [Sporobolomyces koalae]|uniref:uncharacterized protein n=1 Tax=Sporobolomyces koalae TaxID=500713 RepID=UPI00318205AF